MFSHVSESFLNGAPPRVIFSSRRHPIESLFLSHTNANIKLLSASWASIIGWTGGHVPRTF